MAESAVKGLILREIIVELFGNLLPGALFLALAAVVLLVPILSFAELALSLPNEALKVPAQLVHFWMLQTGAASFVVVGLGLIAAYQVGTLFFRQDIKVPDRISFGRIRPLVGDSWVADDPGDCEFPYPFLRRYLETRGLTYLAAMIPWRDGEQNAAARGAAAPGPGAPTSVRRTKRFMDALKLRIQLSSPECAGAMARNEAHVRLNSSSWYMARTLERIAVFGIVLAVGLGLVLHLGAGGPGVAVVYYISGVVPLGVLLSARWVQFRIERVLHYQRVREAVQILEMGYVLFRHRRYELADLCPPEWLTWGLEGAGRRPDALPQTRRSS